MLINSGAMLNRIEKNRGRLDHLGGIPASVSNTQLDFESSARIVLGENNFSSRALQN